ncbi:MAG: hypothetical protein ABJK39_08320 [Hyphomicrobiales bacterium]
MIATALGVLSALMKLVELLVQSRFKVQKDRQDYETILMLRQYRERLEKALQARKGASKSHADVLDDGHDGDSLPDDGFRRD